MLLIKRIYFLSATTVIVSTAGALASFFFKAQQSIQKAKEPEAKVYRYVPASTFSKNEGLTGYLFEDPAKKITKDKLEIFDRFWNEMEKQRNNSKAPLFA